MFDNTRNLILLLYFLYCTGTFYIVAIINKIVDICHREMKYCSSLFSWIEKT